MRSLTFESHSMHIKIMLYWTSAVLINSCIDMWTCSPLIKAHADTHFNGINRNILGAGGSALEPCASMKGGAGLRLLGPEQKIFPWNESGIFFFLCARASAAADSAFCHVTASTSCCSYEISLHYKLLLQYCWRGHDGGKTARLRPNHLSRCAGVFLPSVLSPQDAKTSPGPSQSFMLKG